MKSELFIRQLEIGQLNNYIYIIADQAAGDAAIIDPCDDVELLNEEMRKEKLNLTAVLLTHGHYDHVGGVNELVTKHGVPVYLSEHESPFYTPRCRGLKRIKDNGEIQLGSLEVKCLHTPGHTPGCQCFLVAGNLFTGDTLFINAVGRTDFPGGSTRALFQSLERIKTLPEDTIIWQGHNYGEVSHATLGVLKTINPYLIRRSDKNLF